MWLGLKLFPMPLPMVYYSFYNCHTASFITKVLFGIYKAYNLNAFRVNTINSESIVRTIVEGNCVYFYQEPVSEILAIDERLILTSARCSRKRRAPFLSDRNMTASPTEPYKHNIRRSTQDLFRRYTVALIRVIADD